MQEQLNKARAAIKKASGIEKKTAIATELAEQVRDGNVNQFCTDSKLPVWMVYLLDIEAMVAPQPFAYQQRILTPLIDVLPLNHLSYEGTRNMSFTGRLCFKNAWTSARIIATVDPHLRFSKIPAALSCVLKPDIKQIPQAIGTLEVLRDLGADIDKPTLDSDITPLLKAACFSNIPTIKWLLANGADPDRVNREKGASAWMLALDHKIGFGDKYTRKYAFDAVNTLLDGGANIYQRPKKSARLCHSGRQIPVPQQRTKNSLEKPLRSH